MKKFLLFVFAMILSGVSFGQLTGTKYIPGDYPSIVAAVAALNTSGVGAGGVTFAVAAGYTETTSDSLVITATGTSSNPILFQKSGTGADPLITRTDAGTKITSAYGGQGDAVITFQGSDYLTFDGIDVAASNSGIEYGYYLRKGGVTDGCKFDAIKNATITMTKGTSAYVVGIYSSNNDAYSLVSSATGITVTSTDGRNESIVITGNTISNVFAGIYLRGYNHTASPYNFQDQNNIVGSVGAGNIIQNYAGNTASASYGVYLIYQTSPTVSYNTINNVGGGGANATSTLYGIFMSSSNAGGDFVANNNAITLGQGSTSGAHCIYDAQTGTSININNNTFSYGSFAATTTSYFIYCSNGTNNINVIGNATSGTITKTGAGQLDGYYDFGVPTGGTATISSNNFSNIVLTGASIFYGIQHYTASTQVMVYTNNTISNITGGSSALYGIYQGYGAAGCTVNGNTISNWTGTSSMYGLYLGASTAPVSLTVYNNTVNGLATTGAATVYGIYNFLGTANKIYKNKIYNLMANNASGLVYGITVAGGVGTYVYNNFISDLRTPVASAVDAIRAINITSTTVSSTIGLYYNSIYLNAVSTGTNFGTTGVYHTYSATATTAALDMRNNIIVNNSTPNGTGKTVAFRRSASTSLVNYGSASNNNDFYAGATEDATHAIYYDGTTTYTMAAYKTLVSPRDAFSFRELPPFNNIATTPYNLHLVAGTPTFCESGGTPISSPIAITDDYDGDARSATFPDVGADEGAFTILDLTPPIISYTPLLNTISLSARTLAVTVLDVSGVPTTTPGWPNLYWKINSGSWTAATPISVVSGVYTYSFGSGVTTIGDVVSYYVVAEDQATPPNVGAYPSAGASGFTTDPPAASTPPTTPSSYTIIGTICGDYTVGASGATYPTLDAAIADLNSKQLCGELTLTLLDATYTETSTLTINVNGGSSPTNTVTIKPNAAATVTITGAVASGPIFKILTPYVIINGSNSGGTTRDLTIKNTSTTAPYVIVIGSTGTTPITGVTVKNTIVINGANTSSELVVSDGTTLGAAGYFNNITIQNNSFQLAYMGIYAVANPATGNGSGLLITGNDMNTSGANSIRLVGAYVQGVDGATVSNNNIGNMVNTVDAGNLTGIWFATSTVNSTISGNNIGPISSTTGAPRGIVVTSAVTNSNVNVTGNIVNGITTSYSSPPYGIWVFSTTTGVTIQKNKVSGILNSNTGGYGARGIHVNTGLSASNILIKNNFVYDVKATSDASSTYFVIGIGIEGATSGVKVYDNSVCLSGTYAGYSSATVSAAFAVLTATTLLDIRGNIFDNTYDNTGSSTDKSYAIYSAAANTAFKDINYNDYYVSGAPGVLGYLGADQTTLALWQAATTKDANSVSGDPKYVSIVSPFDLHIQTTATTPVNNANTSLAPDVTDDIDGDLRSVTTPDIGADEYTYAPPAVVDPTGVTATAISSSQIDVAFVPNANSNNVVIVWNLTGSFTAPAGAPPVIGQPFAGGTLLYSGLVSPQHHTSLTATTHYYYKLYSYDGISYSGGVATGATTLCDVISTFPWNEGFEGLSTVGASILPPCWAYTNITSNMYSCNGTCNSNTAHTGTKFIGGSWSFDVWNFTPGMQLTAGISYDFIYWFKCTDATVGYDVSLAYGSAQNVGSMTNVLNTETGLNIATWTLRKFTFSPASSGVYYFGLHTSAPVAPNGIAYDDFTLQLTPSCPVPTSLTATSITQNSANLSWTPGGTETAWEYSYGVSPYPVPTGSGTATTSATVNPISGLSPSTAYQYYVRSNCGTAFSDWVGPYTFLTLCAPISVFPWSEGWETGYVDQATIGGCWSQAITGSYYWVANSSQTTYNRTPRTGLFNATLHYAGDAWLFRSFTLQPCTAYQFSLYARQDMTIQTTIEVKYGTTNTIAGMTNPIIPSTAITSGDYQLLTGTFTVPANGNYFIGVHGVMGSSPYYISIDDLSLQVVSSGTLQGYVYQQPACTIPVAGATVSNGTYSTTTDATGFYQICGLPVGSYNFTASHTDYTSQTINGIAITDGGTTSQNFCIGLYYAPPSNLQAVVGGALMNNVHLTWNAPGSLPANQWIFWDTGTETQSIGTNAAADFSVASRWAVTDISPYAGMYLTKISFFPAVVPASCTYTIKVWTGTTPPTEVYSYTLPAASVTANAWNTYTFPTGSGVPITGSQEFWFGYESNTTTGYPAGCDAGPQIAGKGNMTLWGGVWQELTALNSALTFNWCIHGYVSGTAMMGPGQITPIVQNSDQNLMQNPIMNEGMLISSLSQEPNQGQTTSNQAPAGIKSSDEVTSLPNMFAPQPLSLTMTGYNVYRNSAEIADNVANTYYDDLALAKGGYNYQVSAKYDNGGESAKIGPVHVDIYTCFPPTNLQVANATLTTTSAIATWTASTITPNPEWIYEYGPSGFAHGTGIGGAQHIITPSFTMNSLTPGTEYDFYVRTLCSAGDSSMWVKKTFRTHYFDCPAGATAELEPCGSDLNGGCNMAVPAFEPLACGETKCGTGWYNGTNRDTDWYLFTLTQTADVTWSGKAEFSYMLGIIASGCPATAFIVSSTGAAGTTVSVTTHLTAGTYYAFASPLFAEKVACDSLNKYYATLDCNTCFSPSALTATNITTTSADLGWTPGATETAWEYVIGLAPLPIPTGAGIPTTTNPTHVTGLSGANSYCYYVRSSCGGGVYGAWIGPYCFSTLCDPFTLAHCEPFAIAATIPACWSQTYSGGITTNQWSITASNHAGGSTPNEATCSWVDATGTVRLISGAYNTTGLSSVHLAFRQMLDDYAAGVNDVNIMLQSSPDGVTWTTQWTHAAGIGASIPAELRQLDIPVTTNTVYFAWTVDGYLYDINYWYVDDICVSIIPPAAFDVTGSGSYCSTGTGLTVTLSGSETGVNYQLYKNSLIEGSTVPGTGLALNWTNETAGTYTVTGTNLGGTTPMNGSAVISEDPVSMGGSITPTTTTIIIGQSTGTLVLSGYTGTILKWQKHLVADLWTDIDNTTHTYSETPTATGTWEYRAEVQSGICAAVYSAVATVLVNSSLPVDLEVDGIVTGTICYNATNIITVAGTAPFTVQSGGHVEMIAGVAIDYKPGTTVQSGGYMWGHIAPSGPWCVPITSPSIVTVPMGIEEVSQSFFKVYPNPTTGSFTLELSEVSGTSVVKVEIYGMRGEKILNDQFTGEKKHEFSLESNPTGIYFIRVFCGDNLGSQKIIKQ
jgi:hypothetical protein